MTRGAELEVDVCLFTFHTAPSRFYARDFHIDSSVLRGITKI